MGSVYSRRRGVKCPALFFGLLRFQYGTSTKRYNVAHSTPILPGKRSAVMRDRPGDAAGWLLLVRKQLGHAALIAHRNP